MMRNLFKRKKKNTQAVDAAPPIEASEAPPAGAHTPTMSAAHQSMLEGGADPSGAQPAKSQDEYMELKQSWDSERLDIADDKLVHLFDTDDELPFSKHLLLIIFVVFFVSFVIWASWAKIDEITRGEGKVIPSKNVQVVQTLDAGTIDEFLVKEGDEVTKGQVLIRLSNIQASSDLGANNARYYGLLASITRLQAEAEGKAAVDFPEEVIKAVPRSVTEEINTFRANREQLANQTGILEQQLSQKKAEVSELQTRIADIRGVIGLQQEERTMLTPLVERGSAPRMELLQLKRAMKEKRLELNSALSSLPRVRGAVSEVDARIREIKTSIQAKSQAELSAKLIEMNEVKQRLSALKDRKQRTELVAPVHGIVQEISVNTVGGVISPGDDIIKIIPKDDQLIVEAKVLPSDRAFIYPTQKAIVKITSYDFSIYGGLQAEVIDISADTVEDKDGNSFYRVRLRTSETALKHRGKEYEIIPGMVASVDILTGKKTVMQYMLKPLIKTLDSSLTER